MYITQCVVCNEELVVNDMKPHIPHYCKRYICEKCSQDNWKFTEHGVLINETPVKKKGKK